METFTDFGANLHRLRKAHDWSQAVLARRSGVNKQTIYRLETGKSSNISLRNAIKIAQALGCSTDELWSPHTTNLKGTAYESAHS